MRLADKVALITGAASGVQGKLMGIGGATAWLFSREGASVVITDIKVEDGELTAAEIREAGGNSLFLRLDVTSEENWKQVIRDTVARFGRLDVLVNNAGTGGGSTVEETTEEEWDEKMAIHAKGTFLGMKHAIPAMRQGGGGSIVNVSSVHGIVGSTSGSAYMAAKGAVRILTKAAALQTTADNIRVNSIHPGHVLTPMSEPAHSNPKIHAERMAEVPMGRLATAEDVPYAILYLASDEASYVTGAELAVDGGLIAR